MQTLENHSDLSSLQAQFQQARLSRWMQFLSGPLHSEDPLVKLYALSGWILTAAGALAPHGLAWGALGIAVLVLCSLCDQA